MKKKFGRVEKKLSKAEKKTGRVEKKISMVEKKLSRVEKKLFPKVNVERDLSRSPWDIFAHGVFGGSYHEYDMQMTRRW